MNNFIYKIQNFITTSNDFSLIGRPSNLKMAMTGLTSVDSDNICDVHNILSCCPLVKSLVETSHISCLVVCWSSLFEIFTYILPYCPLVKSWVETFTYVVLSFDKVFGWNIHIYLVLLSIDKAIGWNIQILLWLSCLLIMFLDETFTQMFIVLLSTDKVFGLNIHINMWLSTVSSSSLVKFCVS